MSTPPVDEGTSPQQAPPNMSDYSGATMAGSPESPTHHRHTYRRMPSGSGDDLFPDQVSGSMRSQSFGTIVGESLQRRGLGIQDLTSPMRDPTQRVPVGSKGSPSTPGSADPLLSPVSARSGKRAFGGLGDHMEESPEEESATTAAPWSKPFTVESPNTSLLKEGESMYASNTGLAGKIHAF